VNTHAHVYSAFSLPFACRRQLLYACAFGRERALAHAITQSNNTPLLDSSTGSMSAQSRLTPRLHKRKVTVQRDAVLHGAEQMFAKLGVGDGRGQHGNSSAAHRPTIEIAFDGEVSSCEHTHSNTRTCAAGRWLRSDTGVLCGRFA
jgi:hypothetical protein